MIVAAALAVLYYRAFSLSQPKPGTLEWVGRSAVPPRLTLPEPPEEWIGRADIAALFVLTLLYGAAAFFYLGDLQAPQSFFKFSDEIPSVTLTYAEPVPADRVAYYTGLPHGEYRLELSPDGQTWAEQPPMRQAHGELFRWRSAELSAPGQPVKALRLSVAPNSAGQVPTLELGELALFSAGSPIPPAAVSHPSAARLSDEFGVIPLPPEATILNGSHFDEIYHARTAYEHIQGYYPYEITHPPLGKLLLGLGVRAFGMTPFGWRFVGTLLGVLMVPLFYLLSKRLFSHTVAAVCSTLIFAFDFMHFTQTRIATIDVYGVFFILCMYLCMTVYVTGGADKPFRQTMLPLFLCGLSFGLGAASKWICFYAALGLIALLFGYLIKRRDWGFFWRTVGWCVVCFVLVPGAVYIASYIPYVTAEGGALTLERLWDEFLRNQQYMLNYHSGVTEDHVFSSRWYTWLINLRPIAYVMNAQNGLQSYAIAFLNPVTAWGGLAALLFCVQSFRKSRQFPPLLIVVGYLSQLLPWMFISRITFIYHYFPSVIFLALGLGWMFQSIRERAPTSAAPQWTAALAVGLFALFYPVLSGFPYADWYGEYVLRWFGTWPI
jgi:hypothetical protein